MKQNTEKNMRTVKQSVHQFKKKILRSDRDKCVWRHIKLDGMARRCERNGHTKNYSSNPIWIEIHCRHTSRRGVYVNTHQHTHTHANAYSQTVHSRQSITEPKHKVTKKKESRTNSSHQYTHRDTHGLCVFVYIVDCGPDMLQTLALYDTEWKRHLYQQGIASVSLE